MKTTFCILLVILLTLGATAYGTSAVITFDDPSLEAMIRETIGKSEGDITEAEAEEITRLNLSMEWQRYAAQTAPITDISGLEYFTNLESLDLSFHAITNISPLAGLTKLTFLSLGGNPVIDIAPLAALTNLHVLRLSNCAAQEYSPIEALVNLEFLMLDNSTIADVTPLLSLENLDYLFLVNSRVVNYLPLSDISKKLVEKDFIIASTLAELGFVMNDANKQVNYNGKDVSVSINRSEWGAPPMEWDTNCVRMSLPLEGGYTLNIGFYAEINAYVFDMVKDGEMLMNYVYDAATDNFTIGLGDRESSQQTVRAALGDAIAGDVLLAPIPIFNDTIMNTFRMTAEALYALPLSPPTLKSLGFVAEEADVVYVYSEHEPHDMHISIHRPEWGKSPENSNPEGSNIEFYDDNVNGYSLLILYYADTDMYYTALFKGEENCGIYIYPAANEYSQEYPDQATINQMFSAAFETQGKDLYNKPLVYFMQVVQDHFGMSIDDLYALPMGE